ncbi:MAG: hypothetical protein ABR610_12310 [Thermoanaerobaculia bacterium]
MPQAIGVSLAMARASPVPFRVGKNTAAGWVVTSMGSRRTWIQKSARWAVLAAVIAAIAAPSAGAATAEPRPMDRVGGDPGRVRVTTDREAVARCTLVGAGRRRTDRSLDALLREAAEQGADVVLLRALSDSAIEGDSYRCGTPAFSPAAPAGEPRPTAPSSPSPAPVAVPDPRSAAVPPRRAPPSPAPAAEPGALPQQRPADPAPPESERQRRARAELDILKAAVRVVEDRSLIAGCEKRGESSSEDASGWEDAFRAGAVAVSANLVLVRRATGAPATAEYFRCGLPERPARKR